MGGTEDMEGDGGFLLYASSLPTLTHFKGCFYLAGGGGGGGGVGWEGSGFGVERNNKLTLTVTLCAVRFI